MVRCIVVISLTEPGRLWMTTRNVVASTLSIRELIASYLGDGTEHDGSRADSGSQILGNSSCAPPELEKGRLPGNTFTGGLVEIANKHVAENPDKLTRTIFKFAADCSVEGIDGKSKTITQTLSCASPQWSVKYLTKAIENAFGSLLDNVDIIVDGNELEMRCCGRPLFRSEMKVAESLIPYTICATRGRWCRLLQGRLLKEFVKDEKVRRQRKKNSDEVIRQGVQANLLGFGVDEPVAQATAKRIRFVFDDKRGERLLSDELSSDWGKRLTEELVSYWIHTKAQKNSKKIAEFKFSASSAKIVSRTKDTASIQLFQYYVCSRLRKRTSQDDNKPVIIRIAGERSRILESLEHDIPSHNTFIMQNIGEADGSWVSISDDAAGPGPRRVLVCRTSNFTTTLSDFLRTTDLFKFTSLEGYKQLDGENYFLPSSDSDLPDLSRLCPVELAAELTTESFHTAVTQSECLEPTWEKFSNITYTDGLVEIANKHVAENPDKLTKTIFKFVADCPVEETDGKSKTMTRTLSCTSPQGNLKLLTAALGIGFGRELDTVKIVVVGNELEMWYRSSFLFSSEVKDAESLIPYVTRAACNRWCRVLQRKLIDEYEKDETLRRYRQKDCLNLLRERTDAKVREITVETPAFRARASLIDKRFAEHWLSEDLLSNDLSSDWGKRITEELVSYWFEGCFQKDGLGSVELKCSVSPSENIDRKVPNLFAQNLGDYVRSRLRERTSPADDKPVIVRIASERTYDFLTRYDGPPSQDTCIMQNTGESEGRWVSISDSAAGPGPRRVLICRASNFTTSLSDFLRTTDRCRFTSLKGYTQVDNGNSGFLSSSDSSVLPDLQ